MNSKKKIFIISLIVMVFLSISFTSAAQNDKLTGDDEGEIITSTEEGIQTESFDDYNVSASNQDVLSENERSYGQLQESINNAVADGATFSMNYDYRYDGGDKGHIDITADTTINGNNHYISGNGQKSVFRFDEADDGITLTLKNILFKDCWSDNGGVIHTKTNVNIYIINCTFVDNGAAEDGGAIYFDSNGYLDIKDSTFERCVAKVTDKGHSKHNGGAINVHGGGKLTIDNSIFRNNIAGFGYGGALYVEGECRRITNSIFENNTARSRFGGAVYVESDNENGLVVDNCSFTNNTAMDVDRKSVCGAAISYEGTGLLRLTNSNFTNNNLFGTPTDIKNKWESSQSFYNNKGGAVFAAHDIEIGNCQFIKNHATDMGGAVYTDEGIRWLDGRSVFISNTGGHSNSHIANKGGAIYASKFLNDAKGLVFIDNHCWYGGAVYLNNKNEVTFESCVFINNSVWNNDKKEAPGAAIYVDSTGSKISLINNIFYNNHATDDRGVFNCGKYGTVKNNWYGYNDVNFDDAYLMEWHRVGKNEKIRDSNSLRIELSSDVTEVFHASVKLTLKFVCSDKTAFTGKLGNWTVDFTSNNKGVFSDLQIVDNEATVTYTPAAGDNVVTAKVHGQELSVKIIQPGDFTWLQQKIDLTPSGGVLDLNCNLTYNPDADAALNTGIKIRDSIVINGNGYTINGLNAARIFSIHSNDVKINNITFVNGNYPFDDYSGVSGGAIFIDGIKNVSVSNSKFINNKADCCGGAIAVRNGYDIQFINSQFISNTASQAGAIKVMNSNVTIDGCEFRDNYATGFTSDSRYYGAGAIGNDRGNVTIANSVFLNNKAESYELIENIADNKLTLTLVGLENYVNAIMSNKEIKFTNVTYWDGEITTGDNPVYSQNESGQSITLEIFNKDQKLVKKVTLVTDNDSQAVYDFSNLENGNYTYKATHNDDKYYTTIWTEGNFNLTKVPHNPSSVKINITDGKEFDWGKCNISFEVTNRTKVDVLITNEDESFYFEVNGTTLDYVAVDLPASDKEYYICVYNYANETVEASADYKTFRILKVNTTVNVNPVATVDYGQNVSVSFSGDGTSYNVTVYDINNNVAFSKIVNETAIDIANLAAGEYNVTVINLGSTNRTQSKASTTFNVNKINNNIKVEVTDGTYGKDITVTVTADVDGDYTVYLNTRNLTVYVENGKGTQTIDDLDAGDYNANVTFDSANCNNNATNTTFTIQRAQSHVEIVGLSDVTWNTSVTIRFSDFYPYKYNVTIYDSGNNVKYTNITGSLLFNLPQLGPGQYTFKVANLGNDNVIGSNDSCIFNVVKDNYVFVYAEDAEYGRDLFIYIEADVDGTYTVNIDDNLIEIEVVNGTGAYWGDDYLLDAGDYNTNVTFDKDGYNNIIDNDNFTVYPVESNIRIYEIGNVTYGEDIFVKFHENYPTVFNITLYDINGEVFNTTFVYEDESPEMQVILADFGVGEYLVVIENLGDGQNIIGNYSSMYFNVTKATPQIVVDTSDVTYPEDVVIIITANVDGNYTVKLGNQTQNVILKANEETPVIFASISAGEYVINVTYKETENYTYAFNDDLNVTVNKNDDYDMDIETNETGDITEMNIHFPKDATGNVTVVVNGKGNYTASIINGTATVYIVNLTDDDEFDVIYSGDENYPAKNKNTTNALLYSEIRGSDMTRGYNSGCDYQVTLVDKNGKAVANAQIEFTVNGKKYTALTNANGVAVINPKLAVGTYKITAYNPFNKQNITKTVKIVTRITGNKNVNTYYGKNYQYKLRIIGDNGSPVGAGVKVKVTINGKAKTLKTDKNGYITVKFTKAYLPKTYRVIAEYKGVKVSNKVVVKKVLTLKKVTVKRSAKKLVLKATLKQGKKALKGKKVVFKFKGKKYTAKTNKKGLAKVTIKKNVLKKLKKGKKVKYQVTYLKCTVKRTAKVKR